MQNEVQSRSAMTPDCSQTEARIELGARLDQAKMLVEDNAEYDEYG